MQIMYQPTIIHRIKEVSERKYDWDDKGSLSPKQSLNTALSFFTNNYHKFNTNPSFISSEQDGSIFFDWYYGGKDLHIFCYDDRIEYIKVWGKHIFNEMQSGIIEQEYDIDELFVWLFTPQYP